MLRLVDPSFPSLPQRRFPTEWDPVAGWPGWLARLSGRLTGIHRLRKIYDEVGPAGTPAEFARRCLELLDIHCELDDRQRARIPTAGRTLFVANHPFGALDALIAIATLGAARSDLRVLANTELAAIPELAPIILGTGDPRGNSLALRQALRWLTGEHAVLTFPAGDVAQFDVRTRCISDPPWSPATGRLVQMTDAQVVPVHFSGANGKLFQVAGMLAPRLRTWLLPREIHRQRGTHVVTQVGAPISAARLARFHDNEAVAVHLRLKTFLAPAPAVSTSASAARELGPIAPEMPRDALATEVAALPADRLLLRIGGHDVLCAQAEQIPHLLSEIGRLREIAFRASGDGTGRGRALDRFDKHYEHLLVWDHARQQLAGACRIGRTDRIRAEFGQQGLHCTESFRFRKPLLGLLGPALELGLFCERGATAQDPAPLALLWKGIGELVAREPRYCRLLGSAAVGSQYTQTSRDLLVGFLRRHRADALWSGLVRARHPYASAHSPALGTELALLSNLDPLCALVEDIEPDGKSVPALLTRYLGLGGRVLAVDTDTTRGRAVDCLMLVDLRHSKPRMLQRFFGDSALARFRATHRALKSSNRLP
jgi:putative hemolysin